MRLNHALLIFALLIASAAVAQEQTPPKAPPPAPALDERPAAAGDWGYRPANEDVSPVNPPSFSWRPQTGLTWELECARDAAFSRIEYRAKDLEFNVHCPPRVLQVSKDGAFFWRYRGRDREGRPTKWSQTRSFSIAPEAKIMPLPPREELLERAPKTHPRLFMRPEGLERLRELAGGDMKEECARLIKNCESYLKRPPSTEEPLLYPKGMIRGGDPWRSLWWGNRERVQSALGAASTLAFTRLLTGREEFGVEARRILLECAKWDPKGSTGFRYNDEAGMPYNYYFARTYTFVHDLLSAEDREICRRVMRIRGEEMYRFLCPSHFWRPYSSHSNRSWHFLGEVGIAFLGEIEGAEDWVWFAVNVFHNAYPVWSDSDGGWHEGSSYWSSYQRRFGWWADVMREALDIDAYDKPYFSQAGYFAMYLMPPGKRGGGFGDLTAKKNSSDFATLMTGFAAQAGNPHWRWWVDAVGGPRYEGGYEEFSRAALPKVAPEAPDALPSSRLFRGTGLAFLNADLTDATNGAQIAFKSSPFGTQSHGYESNNAFLLSAYGERLLIRSGIRDSYGSDHHKNWMWNTKSVNSITVNGVGQQGHSAASRGEIIAFKTTPEADILVGEAAGAYPGGALERFTRAIVFVKPDVVIVYDRLEAPVASTFEYRLHAINEFSTSSQRMIQIKNGGAACDIDFLAPDGLVLSQTDQYDPNPRERVSLREWHLTAATPEKNERMEFVALYRTRRASSAASPTPTTTRATLERVGEEGYVVRTALAGGGRIEARLPLRDGAVTVQVWRPDGGAVTVSQE